MSKQNNNMGKIKRSTDDLINEAIARQSDWQENRREYTRVFLKSLNMFARPSKRKQLENQSVEVKDVESARNRHGTLRAYWFPIVCALLVIFIAIWVMFIRGATQPRVMVVPVVPEPIVQKVNDEFNVPTFDIVRIEKDGDIVIAGRWLPYQNISIVVNKILLSVIFTISAVPSGYAISNLLSENSTIDNFPP